MNIIRYISKDKLDLFLLMVTIALGVRFYMEGHNVYALLAIYSLYIIGVVVRFGKLMNIIDQYVTDKTLRRKLNLHPIPGEVYIYKRSFLSRIIDILFWIVLMIILYALAFK